jgi:hypothetical protein
MGAEGERSDRIRTALFVDFDNIYSCFKELYGEITAKSFGNHVEQWVEWIERSAIGIPDSGRPCSRKLLLRRCYLNPECYKDYRNNFTLAAFEVVDCPKLTRQGKTSTDMHLVMDVLDALAFPVRLDEFIILSGDADFTPLLLRLRRYDRITAIFSAGYASAAYKAASDRIIPVDDFLAKGLPEHRSRVHANGGQAPHFPAVTPESAPAECAPAAVPEPLCDLPAAAVDIQTPAAEFFFSDPPPERVPGVRLGPKSSFPGQVSLISRIAAATGVPRLLRSEYAMLFKELAGEINSNGFHPENTSLAVQRRCADKHVMVVQAHIEGVMEGCHRANRWFSKGKESAETIAQGYLTYVEELCRKADLKMSEIELALLHNWLTGKKIPRRVQSLAN